MFKLEQLAAGLDVVGHLSILADDAAFQVEFGADAVEVVLPDLRTALHLFKTFSRDDRRAWARSVHSVVARTGRELRIWVKHRQVGRLAAASQRGWLAAWLGVDPLEVNTGAVLATLLGQKPPAPDNRTLGDHGIERMYKALARVRRHTCTSEPGDLWSSAIFTIAFLSPINLSARRRRTELAGASPVLGVSLA